MMLISLSDLKSFVGVTSTGFDGLLTDIIEYYSSDFEQRLNRKLKSEERTEKFNGGKRIYSLPAYPIDLGAALTLTHNGTAQTKDKDFFVWEERGVIEFKFETFRVEPQELVVTWTGGYTETVGVVQVPDDLKGAARIQCAYLFRRRDDLGLASISMPDGSIGVQAPASLLPEVEGVLTRYRRRPF